MKTNCLSMIFVLCFLISLGNLKGDLLDKQYELRLRTYLEKVLEDFRDQMKDGISKLGIPPADPLTIPDIDEDIKEDIAEITLRMKDIKLAGLSKFRIQYIDIDLKEGFANISFELPKLSADGHCYVNGKVLSVFPVNGDGNFTMEVEDIHFSGHGLLHIHNPNANVDSYENVKVRLSDFLLHVDLYGPVDAHFEKVFGEGAWSETLNKVIASKSRAIIRDLHYQAMPEVSEIILKIINTGLDKGTLGELLNKFKKHV